MGKLTNIVINVIWILWYASELFALYSTNYDCVPMNVKLKVDTCMVVGMLINKLSLIWPISLYTGLALLFCIKGKHFSMYIFAN